MNKYLTLLLIFGLINLSFCAKKVFIDDEDDEEDKKRKAEEAKMSADEYLQKKM